MSKFNSIESILMILRILFASAFCGIGLLVLTATDCCCQDNTSEHFRTCINNFADSRSGIASYCVKINRLIFSPKVVTGLTADNDTMFSMSQSKIEIAADCLNDRGLFICSSPPFSWDTGTATQDLFLAFGTHFFRLTENGFAEFPGRSAIVPDPLSLGGGQFPETTHFYPLTEVISSLHAWHSGPEKLRFDVQQRGPLLSFRHQEDYFVFDTTRAFQLVEIGSGSPNTNFKIDGRTVRRDTRVKGNVSLVLVNGIWLPGTVSYINGENDFCHMSLDWVTVNQPLPECLFDREALAEFFLNDEPLRLESDQELKKPGGAASSQSAAHKLSPLEEVFEPNLIPSIQLAILLLDPSIQAELGITEEVQKHVIATLKQLRPYAPPIATVRDELPEKRLELFRPLMQRAIAEDKKLWKVLDELLPPSNMDRLIGGYLMMNGLSGVLNQHIAERLALDDEQKQKIRRAIESLRIQKRRVLPLAASGNLEQGDMPLFQPNRSVESGIIRLVMTPKQLRELDNLLENSKLKVPSMRFTFGW